LIFKKQYVIMQNRGDAATRFVALAKRVAAFLQSIFVAILSIGSIANKRAL
jgi:hypothetical protein